MGVYSVLMFLPVVLVFIFPNYYGFDVLVYLGWTVLAIGIVLVFLAGYEFQKEGGVPEGKHLIHTTVLVDSGIYAIVRHPQYLGFILIILGLVLVSQHWLSVASGVIGSVMFRFDVRKEEEASIEKFGEDYRRYMERVPGMNVVAGAMRLRRRSRKE